MLSALLDRALGRIDEAHGDKPLTGAAPDSVTSALLNESAATLYRHAPLGLASASLMSVLMMLAIDLVSPGKASWSWMMVSLIILGLRLAHALHWRAAASPPPAATLVRQYAAGVAASAAMWSVLPWVIYARLDSTGCQSLRRQ